jgi:hypothetical protein
LATKAGPSQVADGNALTDRPIFNAFANSINPAYDLMARHSRILDAWN